ncbi:MAG TPA: substrate-binding domain-containing protein, partial [Gaiellales bacterium]|nr:substrate-binding domain-containing protein [Gaiellales bacterium]
LTNPLFPPIIRGMEEVLDRAGYTTLVASTDGDPERERQRLRTLTARQVDGFLVATAERGRASFAELVSAGMAVVLVNRTVEHGGVFAVVPDDRKGLALAVAHLVELGHRRIAHLAGPQRLSTGRLRYRGFLEAMDDHGLAVDRRDVVHADAFTEAAGALAARRLLRLRSRPTAIVAANDLLALGVYTALQSTGLRCPDDVSVIGFNGMPFTDRFSPPLSTILIPHAQIGARAAELLLERIDDPHATPQTLMFEPSLLARASTAPPRA